MNKQEIKEKIKKQLECDDDTAERIFHRALEDKMITVRLNWNFVVHMSTFFLHCHSLVITKTVNVDTCFRDSYYSTKSSNFHVNFENLSTRFLL